MGTVITVPPEDPDDVALRHDALTITYGFCGSFQPASPTPLEDSNGARTATRLRAPISLHPSAAGDRGGLRAADIARLPQGGRLDGGFTIGCREVVALAAPELDALRALGRRRLAGAATAALERVDLGEIAARPVHALSAGHLQHLLFARAIPQDAAVILMDEPFSAVDAPTTRLLLAIIMDWHAQGRTMIVVPHDMDLVCSHFPQTLMLTGETTDWGSTTAVFDRWPRPGWQGLGSQWSSRQAA